MKEREQVQNELNAVSEKSFEKMTVFSPEFEKFCILFSAVVNPSAQFDRALWAKSFWHNFEKGDGFEGFVDSEQEEMWIHEF